MESENKMTSVFTIKGRSCVLRNASAMIAEREALRKGIEHFDSFISDSSEARLTLKLKIQVGQHSTNLMRSLCVSSIFTVV